MMFARPADAPGSSPRVRGPQFFTVLTSDGEGLIPASAGTTFAVLEDSGGEGAHPRECGDHINSLKRLSFQRGSSPRVRGPQVSFTHSVVLFGLIPASAGTTTTPWRLNEAN